MHASDDAAAGHHCRKALGDSAADELLGRLMRNHMEDEYRMYLHTSKCESSKETDDFIQDSIDRDQGKSPDGRSAEAGQPEAEAAEDPSQIATDVPERDVTDIAEDGKEAEEDSETAKQAEAAKEAEGVRKAKLEAIVSGHLEVREQASRERWKIEEEEDSGDEALGVLSSLGRSMSTWASVAMIGFSFTMSSDPTVAGRQIANLCRRKGGIYVKAAQTAFSMDYAFPKEVLEEFQSLQDSADAQSWGEISERVEKHTPGGIDMVYESFSEDPVNAASIAQVHVAQRKTGDKVAVKHLGVF